MSRFMIAALAAEVNGLATVATPADSAQLEELVAQLQIEDGPLAEFVAMRARVANGATADRAEVGAIAELYGAVNFPADPFPALVCLEEESRELQAHLLREIGGDAATELYAVAPSAVRTSRCSSIAFRAPSRTSASAPPARTSPLVPALRRVRARRSGDRPRRPRHGRVARPPHPLLATAKARPGTRPGLLLAF
ncbi:hypothetical protein O1R50_01895 [Glycomyces luteolus]|uniref:Uncharacterized protein n=1 Tax=Glycomyces luteolus TaxID=2670330 RepID=A0A9X3P734_9ACTN|nr:hypothetical protein [Glycomyces luteolus]MDA1358352.1 hypothetical protein [Glycomyces luteolus]